MKTLILIQQKSKLFFIAVNVVVLFLFSCQKKEIEPKILINPTYLAFGEYTGDCAYACQPCISMFKLNQDTLIQDLAPSYPSYNKIYEGFQRAIIEIDSSKEKVRQLISKIPIELLDEKEVIIGQPDATDGGGLYIEIKDASGERHFWLIDKVKDNIPDYLHPLVDEVHNLIPAIKLQTAESIGYGCGYIIKPVSIIVVKDCTGTYLRRPKMYHGMYEDFQVCNLEMVDSFPDGTMINVYFSKIDKCYGSAVDQIICKMLHPNEGWVEIIKVVK